MGRAYSLARKKVKTTFSDFLLTDSLLILSEMSQNMGEGCLKKEPNIFTAVQI